MREQISDKLPPSTGYTDPVIFVHAGQSGAAGQEWTEQLSGYGMPVFSHLQIEGCKQTQHAYAQLGSLLAELAQAAPGSPVIIAHAGLHLESKLLKRLADETGNTGEPLARTVLSNFNPEFNPFAGLTGHGRQKSGALSGMVELLGPGLLHELFTWPEHLLALSASAVKALSGPAVTAKNALSTLQEAGGRLDVSDTAFAHAPAVSLFNAARLQAHESVRPMSWGVLSSRLQDWLDADCPGLNHPDDERKPATLHVTHSWGGGVALWTGTFIRFDSASRHFQLRSEGPQSGKGSGQSLNLYAGDQTSCPIARWWLQPPIQSIQDSNEQYREILREICQRYGIGRIIVSSLVGHSLDALRSGLPSVQVLHDHFPGWPFLSANPADYTGPDGRPDFEGAISDRRLNREFPDHSAASWQRIGARHLEALRSNGVRLAAPGASVIELQKKLDPDWSDVPIELIPHGFPPFGADGPVVPRPRKDKKLRLVILGRIQPGKGQQLLREALSSLRPHAHIYLLGAGKSGEDFFGLSGVNVIVDYDRDELPSLMKQIGPQLGALLSLVPETFSYTLSELFHLRIPVIATRVGSFPGRIRHGETGWLVEPTARAFADQVAWLAGHREEIEQVRGNLSQVKHADPADMVRAFNTLCTPLPPAELPRETLPGVAQVQAAAFASRDTAQRAALKEARQELARLNKEVSKRTAWALDNRRDLLAEQERRERWVEQLKAEERRLHGLIEEQAKALDALNRELTDTHHALRQSDMQLDRVQKQFGQVRQDLEQLQQLHGRVLASSSWRLTRPFRVLRRTWRNFKRARAWNPLRWPLLISGLVRNLSTVGLRGTLDRMQAGHVEAAQQPVPIRTMEDIGDPSPPESVPHSARPQVSIVIPAYNNWVYTAACLRSINEARGMRAIEVILVDDCSSDETEQYISNIKGLKYIRNQQNSGFIASCNRGASEAKGEYLVLLNNDTQVLDNWIDRLLDTFDAFPDTGLVGSRLVYPDGSLQECGGIVFKDGSGWNYGRGDKPDRPEYQFVREVDYCSGACIMIETSLFRELGGFDECYAPAYYEDTDLAFRVRASGRAVLVQPASTVIHHEGITSGTDTDSGAKRYQLVNQEKFKQRWKPELAGYPASIEDATDTARVRAARDHHLRGKILVIDANTPEPDQDSGSVRLTYLMRCFRELGFGVSFFAENHLHAGRYTQALQSRGIEVLYEPWLESNHAFFRERGAECDYVFVSRHYVAANFIPLVRRYCPGAKFLFDTVDLHYLREQRLAELEDSAPLRHVAAQTRRSELAVMEQSDAVLVVSETEVEVLAKDAPGAQVHVLSNIHEVPGRRVGFADRKDLFFVGGYQHPPNVDAAKWFVKLIWPLIHEQLPGVHFHLIGSKAPAEIRDLKGEGVIFHGFVEDLEHYLDGCRMAVAPLRYGAGVKGKVNMSMSRGQPVVATPMAVEGIHARHGHDVLVADTERAFADEVIRLYRDEDLWNRISDAGISNVESHFSVGAAKKSLQELLQKLEAS